MANSALINEGEAYTFLSGENVRTRRLFAIACDEVHRRFDLQTGLPGADFDLLFFVETLSVVFRDQHTLRDIFAGKLEPWWDDIQPREELEQRREVPTSPEPFTAAWAQGMQRTATITGGRTGDSGKCTVQVVVDGSAEVEIRATVRRFATFPGSHHNFAGSIARARCPRILRIFGSPESTAVGGRS